MVNGISEELLHVPGTVDVEMRAEFEHSAVCGDEGSAEEFEEGERDLVLFEVATEEFESVRIALRPSCGPEEAGPIERVGLAHAEPNGHRGMNVRLRQSYADESAPAVVAAFPSIDRSLRRAVKDLHDYLWTRRSFEGADLVRRLERSARDLDACLGARGRIPRAIRPLLHPFHKSPTGPDLYTFLDTVSNLSAAVELARRSPHESAGRARELVVSLSIGLASKADSFHLVDAFESGKTDFDVFASGLAEALEQRGAVRAREFQRLTEEAFDLHALWDKRAPLDFQRIAAVASIGCSALAAVLYVEALRALGKYRAVPYGELLPVVRTIVNRIGGQP